MGLAYRLGHESFLPPIHLDDDKGEATLISDKALCKELERNLHIGPFFLTKDAWNANGFFSVRHVWKSQASQGNTSLQHTGSDI